jgi:HD-GYP domain-containing protein (c-di-GMP phosphodiesterase class II)
MEQAPLNRELRVLMLEDTPTDAELAGRELRKAGIAFISLRVGARDAFVKALDEFRPDILLSDYNLPDFNGLAALEIVQCTHPEVPVVMVTGALSDIEAVDLIHAGAKDYVLKDRLARLAPAVQRALSAEQEARARKEAERALKHANRALATISAVNRQLVYATDENALLQAICQAIVEQRGYRMASVGYAQQDADKTIKIVAHAGHDDGYLNIAQLSWAENEHGMGPSGRAIRGSVTQLCQDIANDPLYLPWRDAALRLGFSACIALPLTGGDDKGEVFGILAVYADEANAFSAAEVDLLEEMAGDLAFGVRTLHMRHERDLALEKNQHYLAQLQSSLEDTVRVIADIVELRDPYTAGHQRRVGELAMAIARKIGLSEDQINGIHFAAIIHDLGKISIPAEILSKPGKLTDIEYMLVKTHAQAGYNILKDVKFPWPIADIVLQHHERMCGSGYPQGLKGEQILLESRIIAVADVVEAMSSHRPYRPGLGIDAALEEIVRHRGVQYDPQAVDACVKLFREAGYKLPE